jgi:cytidylate kinase
VKALGVDLEKKNKKELLRTHARKTEMLRRVGLLHQQTRDHAQEEQAAMLEAQHEASLREEAAPEQEAWSARTQMIRNRLTNQQRKSTDRWNRFAGTSGGGGMGR